MSRKVSEMYSSDSEITSDPSSSPFSYTGSPNQSPCQQVPQLTNHFTELTCVDPNGSNNKPYLRIVEQPQDHFRFRYKSEMVGTHGCLLGKTSFTNKTKTHPMVELVNYSGYAVIRCRLAQHLRLDEHPHQLLEDERENGDVQAKVPERGSYRVGFPGMGIIHTAKKDVPLVLFKRYKERKMNKFKDDRELMNYCEAEAKGINLNIVTLRFSAHDVNGVEICPPVFSEPIHNMKSAATNDLKICRINRISGRPKGGDDVYILVEKVNRKNIEVHFIERNAANEIVWSAKAHFLQSDVHHQYAIVFRTPAYKNQQLTSDVKVSVELVRPSDGRSSEPKEFTYRADPFEKLSKKRKATNNSPYSSFNSFDSTGSSKSLILPATVQELTKTPKPAPEYEGNFNVMLNAVPVMMETSSMNLEDALSSMACDPDLNPTSIQMQCTMSPMLAQSDPPTVSLHSSDWSSVLRTDLNPDDTAGFQQLVNEYLSPDFAFDRAVTDSGRGKSVIQHTKEREMRQGASDSRAQVEEKNKVDETEKANTGYTAVYTPEQGSEVKKLVKEICESIRSKTGFKKPVIKDKLERLLALRLSNGDTFLHMSLYNNRTSFEYLVKLIHTMRMPHLLNLTNDLQQTILHSAIINDLPKVVTVLIANGCDPMVGDHEGNNAVHYAVLFGACMEPLLNSIKDHGVSCDLNAVNKEKQTALHLAAVPGTLPASVAAAVASIRLLLRHGASHNARDAEGRTPLHLAACDDRLPVARALLDFIPETDIDAEDGRGLTALQIVCGGDMRDNTIEFLTLLINKKADPWVHSPHNRPAWALSRDKPALRAAMDELVPCDADIKSEPEDEYESADEGEDSSLSDLQLYVSELAAVLDASGAWRALAARLQHDALANWYENTPSPTRTLLTQLKECHDNPITSKSLVLILEDLGQKEAALVIRSRVGSLE